MSDKTDLLDNEIKAFIYQQVNELENLLSPESTITVLSKDAKKMIKKLKKNEELDPDFNAKFCYEFNLEDSGEKLNTYGLANTPYEAISIAKDKMLKQLILIQNEIISSSEHINEVNQYLNGGNTKH